MPETQNPSHSIYMPLTGFVLEDVEAPATVREVEDDDNLFGEEETAICRECGDNYRLDFMVGAYCRECNNSRCNIQGYSTRVERILPWYPKRVAGNYSSLYMGVELEVERKFNHQNVDFSEIIGNLQDCKQYQQWAIAKSDGSLDDGFEVVTAPSYLVEHTARWPFVLERLRKHTASWRRGSTGLHVHLNRKFFTPLSLAKFVYFINAEETRKEIVTLAGRTSPDFGRLKKKKLGDAAKYNERRYEAVNLEPTNTIEVRIFKGTLSTLHVLADIEFCHALAMYVTNASIQELTWPHFWSFVYGKKEYKHFLKYMAQALPKANKHILENFAQPFYTFDAEGNKVYEEIDSTRNFFRRTEGGTSVWLRELDSEGARYQEPLPLPKNMAHVPQQTIPLQA